MILLFKKKIHMFPSLEDSVSFLESIWQTLFEACKVEHRKLREK